MSKICKVLFFISLAMCGFVSSKTTGAQTFSINNILDFGEVLDTGSSGGGGNDRIRVNADGTFSHDPEFVVIQDPSPADISFTGGPPNTNYTVTVSSIIFIRGGNGGRWRVNNYNFFPAALSTNSFGDGQFFVGARANTRRGGNTGSYADDTFTGTFEINVNFMP